MNATKILASAALFLASAGLISCSDDKNGGDEPTLTTKIYLAVPDGTTNISADYADDIDVSVRFSAPLAEATEFDFAFVLTGSKSSQAPTDNSILTVVDNPVTITKGATTANIKVKTLGAEIEQTVSLMLGIKSLDTSKFELKEAVTFTVTPPTIFGGLTEEQKALIVQIKTEKGIDLTPWMGNISLTGTIEFPGDGNRAPFVEPTTIQLGGTSVITLGSEASTDNIALTMESNTMGMTDYLYDSMLKLTVKDKEYFDVEDSPNSTRLMELLNWNENTAETFEVSLPNFKIVNYDASSKTAEIEFTATGEADYMLDKNGDKIYNELFEDYTSYNGHTSWIPFSYKFSAWDRNLDLFAAQNAEIVEFMGYNIVADPKMYLGINDINEDYWELEENNLYVTPKGSIDFANGVMTFEFPFDHADQYGYSRVKVSYTIAK